MGRKTIANDAATIWINVEELKKKMSQIRKSASFRSRIPIRRAKPLPRRCYSPPPYVNRTMFNQSDNDNYIYDRSNNIESIKPAAGCQNYHNHRQHHQNKQKAKRQRHIMLPNATPVSTINHDESMSMDTTTITATARPITMYSSSSYSSSDESQESEAPIQVKCFDFFSIWFLIEFYFPSNFKWEKGFQFEIRYF